MDCLFRGLAGMKTELTCKRVSVNASVIRFIRPDSEVVAKCDQKNSLCSSIKKFGAHYLAYSKSDLEFALKINVFDVYEDSGVWTCLDQAYGVQSTCKKFSGK